MIRIAMGVKRGEERRGEEKGGEEKRGVKDRETERGKQY